jgi:hypothetical protein
MSKTSIPTTQHSWRIVERPGYLGGKKDQKEAEWNEKYGKGNWRLDWVTAQGDRLTYDRIIEIYTEGYAEYFRQHMDEAKWITDNFAYGYDLDLVSKEMSFDPYALWQKPGYRNQFHQVAFNHALEFTLGLPFKGRVPIQVRDVKGNVPEDQKPLGWKWNPGAIPCPYPEMIPNTHFEGQWWPKGSIEDLYQSAKVLEVRQ